MVATRSDLIKEYLEKEVGEVKQDLNKLKGDVDLIKEYLEELYGWMVKSQYKLDALSLQNKAKQPVVQESPQASTMGVNAGETSRERNMENALAVSYLYSMVRIRMVGCSDLRGIFSLTTSEKKRGWPPLLYAWKDRRWYHWMEDRTPIRDWVS